ncbi:MAG TPA: hypothetical protein VF731_11810 [Solirubrobacterales bacterium]
MPAPQRRDIPFLLAAPGLYAVADVFNLPIALGVAALAALCTGVALAFHSDGPGAVVAGLMRVAGTVLFALLVLVTFDIALNLVVRALHHIHPLHDFRLPILLGLGLAVVVFAAAAIWYLRRTGSATFPAWEAGLALAALVILAAPLAVGMLKARTVSVPGSAPVPSQLDLLIVTDGRHHPAPAEIQPTPALAEFQLTYSVGVAEGDGVRWTLVEGNDEREALTAVAEGAERPSASARPASGGQGEAVLALLVDGTDPVVENPAELPDREGPSDEVGRWTRVAAAAAPSPRTPVFALLQTTDPARLARWKGWESEGAVSVQALGSQTVTDAAFRLAVAAPGSQSDFALAMRYRPVLLFDRAEPVPWPLSIPTLFREGRVRLCHDEGVHTTCPSQPTLLPSELENGSTSLRLDLRGPEELRPLARAELRREEAEAEAERAAVGRRAEQTVPEGTPPPGSIEAQAEATPPVGAGSAIYVHPTEVAQGQRRLLYLDYWWYLPENPVELGGGALCGAGLVIEGLTCDNHQSDWEGMTVELNVSGAEPRPLAVQYAQHDGVLRYRWPLLTARWKRPDVRRLLAREGLTEDAAGRPLAFSAEGTHATYPSPCANCHQVRRPTLREEPHRGDLPWVGDYTGACGRASCLQLLPTRARGTKPASWNAYENPWGELDCFFVYYCDSGTPPRSPGQQGRYKDPAAYTETVAGGL